MGIDLMSRIFCRQYINPMTDKEEIKDGVVEEFYNKGQFKFRRNPKFEIPDELHYTDAVHRNQ